MSCLLDGYSVTDAAHLAGFAGGPHANKVCWEMTGATPRELADAVRRTHGFLNFVGLGGRFTEAASEAAGALRVGLAVGSGWPAQRRAGELVGIGDIP